MDYSTYGRHILLDCYGVSFDTLDDLSLLSYYMVNALDECGATIVDMNFKKFEPHGVTILYLLAESHLSIHTYPEHGFCAIDCYTCGEDVDPRKAISYLTEKLKPKHAVLHSLTRGLGEITNED